MFTRWEHFWVSTNLRSSHSVFHMSTTGDAADFSGSEWHGVNGVIAYRFDFRGGRIV
jgi:hypothetical protein